MRSAADKVAAARHGDDSYALIEAAAELCKVLRDVEQFKEALERKRIRARFEFIGPVKYA